MTNKEKYADKIIDITVSKLALKDGEPVPCAEMRCSECGFYISNYSCKHKMLEWLDSEYVEPPVDWSKVAVDTPILVREHENCEWTRRHFAKIKNGTVFAWRCGATSWSEDDEETIPWKYAKLAESEEVNRILAEEEKTGGWIPVTERLPEDDKYIMISFKNSTLPDIGRYEADKDGNGAFYPGDDEKSYVEYDLFVNAWMPLPEPYRESEE